MDVRGFLACDWTGRGVVRGLLGRTLRRFTVAYESRWSQEHRAFHVDERVTYADGREMRRAWAVVADDRGTWTGTDDSGGRMVVRAAGDGLVLNFDRSRVVRGFSAASLSLKLRPEGADVLNGRGVTRVLGLPLTRTDVVYTRTVDDKRKAARPGAGGR